MEANHSQRSCDGLSTLLKVMFPDSAIADSFKLSRSKCGYLINHGFAPYFSEVLLSEIESSPFYDISFDESLNKKVQMGQMDILICFWNQTKCIAETRYF